VILHCKTILFVNM